MSSKSQDDYYTFANKSWLETKIIPPGNVRCSVFDEQNQKSDVIISSIVGDICLRSYPENTIEDKLKVLYESYLEEVDLSPSGQQIISELYKNSSRIGTLDDLFYFCGWRIILVCRLLHNLTLMQTVN